MNLRAKDFRVNSAIYLCASRSSALVPRPCGCRYDRRGFTLIELLIVVAIIAILAALATVNFRHAIDRSLQASNAANLRVVGMALQTYFVDMGELPPADREAGPFMSHGAGFTNIGNGPAAGGSWDGVPWLLYERGYLHDWKTLFCPRYLRLYPAGGTIRGGYPRFHNFRYAYNSSAMSSGGLAGGDGNLANGNVWMLRDLFLSPNEGFYASRFPDFPADFTYPWDGLDDERLEHVMYPDMIVRLVTGGE